MGDPGGVRLLPEQAWIETCFPLSQRVRHANNALVIGGRKQVLIRVYEEERRYFWPVNPAKLGRETISGGIERETER